MMSRKYYRMLARVIKNNTILNSGDMLPHNKINKITLISDLINELHNDNSYFDSKRFIDACAIDDD